MRECQRELQDDEEKLLMVWGSDGLQSASESMCVCVSMYVLQPYHSLPVNTWDQISWRLLEPRTPETGCGEVQQITADIICVLLICSMLFCMLSFQNKNFSSLQFEQRVLNIFSSSLWFEAPAARLVFIRPSCCHMESSRFSHWVQLSSVLLQVLRADESWQCHNATHRNSQAGGDFLLSTDLYC